MPRREGKGHQYKKEFIQFLGYQLKAGQFVGWALPTINERSA